MDRRSLIKHAGIAGVLAAGVAPAVHAQQAMRWRIASSFPKSLDTIFGAAEVFAKKVGELSGGKFTITVHAGGELMPPFGVLDGTSNGTVEMAHTAPYYFFGKDPTYALDCAIPFGLNSRQMTAWMYQGNGLSLMREFYANVGIVNFPMGNTGAQMGGWYRKEIKSLADMKGLKMRIGGFGGKVLERIGAVPQNIPGGEIYQSLEKGTIDAAEWVGPYDDLKLGFNKVAPHYYYPGWWEGGPQLTLFVNKKAYDGLSSEYKAMIETAAAYAHTDMQAKYDAKNPAALKTLVSQGTKLHPFPADVMNAAFKAAEQIYAELSASNPAWKKIYADFSAFRRDQNLWFRFTENAFDSFMQRQKL
ncbi:TRAP-type mannitol/chloroaromatic compound transport system substrate-binding protein [Tibeticola sediminis]|uniref:TRAP-type mannitol/chloroaromatic compound transport system substrate-binding protein n=1 Tax=Tibeticola sediminis TaxID=1917811 RepID=A0A3N4UV79_9BURK|nr:TRAP transporter substrate-binding protein [Tibeticola sediminis]RPE64604.1 TRAP-type mannitol/chloroaromatic compound transport system substrate-binding protein [Tibeticola sediminis]